MLFDLSKTPAPFAARRKLDAVIQQLHETLHPNQPPSHWQCSLCLGMKGKGWAKHLETAKVIDLRPRTWGKHRRPAFAR